jgi:hypothetical protein
MSDTAAANPAAAGESPAHAPAVNGRRAGESTALELSTAQDDATARAVGSATRVAFVGDPALLDGCAPARSQATLACARFAIPRDQDGELALAGARAFEAHVTVVFDPPAHPPGLIESLPGVTLGVLTEGAPSGEGARSAGAVDRLVGFDPALTGTRVGDAEVWRAVPPAVSDELFAQPRPLHRAPRAMSIGRSTAHREAMLMPAKHHHDLLQVLHGVSGSSLAELLAECDVGVYVGRAWGASFGWQAAMHLAAGHLLIAEPLAPAHGLECGIDYLQLHSPEGLVHTLDRLVRFPEMGWSARVRGRMKAEHFRASRLFGRIVHDLLLDVAAFGGRRKAAP